MAAFCKSCESICSVKDVEERMEGTYKNVLHAMNESSDNMDEIIALDTDCSIISHTLSCDMECPHCQQPILDIEVEVAAYAEWDNHLNDERMPQFLGFARIHQVSVLNKLDSILERIDVRNLIEIEEKSLIIICKSKMNGGFCYIGYSTDEGCLYRPMYRENPGKCCWPQEKDMALGTCYQFKKVYRSARTYLPHSNNDLLVSEIFQRNDFNCGELYELLLPLAKTSLSEIFGFGIGFYKNGGPYVNEGTDCQSVGILMIESRIEFEFLPKPRLRIMASDTRSINLPWTSTENLIGKRDKILQREGNKPLVVISLARGFNSDGTWQQNRCTLLAVNMIL